MENVLIELQRAERTSLDPALPSIAGARAALRGRLAELRSARARCFSLSHVSAAWPAVALGGAALAAVMVIAGVLVFGHSARKGAEQPFMAADQGVLPNQALTPGAARQASLGRVCSLSQEEVVKAVSPQLRERVFAEYGIPLAEANQYEVDYLITPGLGGEDNIRNLWPEPYYVSTWNARTKDILEERLHELVCAHQLGLSAAQRAIATNWIAAYEKYVREAPSHPRRVKTPFLPQSISAIVFIETVQITRRNATFRPRTDGRLSAAGGKAVAGALNPLSAERPIDLRRLI